MKACISLAREMSEGTYYKALKVRGEVVEGNVNDLLWDLVVYSYALQKVVDALWELNKVPKKSQIHQLLYPILRSYDFRAHAAKNIYTTTLTLIKSARKNNGSKPLIRKMSTRLDYQDVRVDIDSGVVKVILRSKWYTLKLMHRREYIERFKGLRWKEVHVKYCNGKLYVSIVFEVKYLHKKTRNIVIDWCRKFAKEIILKARKHHYVIALEDLTHLRESMSKNKDTIVWKLTMFTYRKLQETIVSKAIEYSTPIVFINPRNTSSTCPRCYTKLFYDHRLAICSKCGLIANRNVVGAMNIWLRLIHAYAEEHGSLPSAPAMKDETRQSRRTKNEGMKKIIKSIQK